MRNSEAAESWKLKKKAFAYVNEQLVRAATFRVAEFQVSRMFALRPLNKYFFKAPIASNARLTGWRQGRRPGLISLIFESAEYHGAQFDWAMAPHQFDCFQELPRPASFKL